MPLVELPSGQAIEFPEGVTPEQMTGALRRDFPQFYAGTQLQSGDIAGEEARQKPTVADTTGEYPGMPRNRMESFTVGTGEVREKLFNPRVTFPKFVPQEGEPAAMTYGKEAVNILAGIPEFMSSDVGLAGLAVAPAAPLLVGGVFLADTLHSLGQQIKSSYENWSKMSDTQKRVAITDLAGTGAFSVLLGHGVRRGVETRFQPVKSAGRQLAKEIKRTELPPAIDAEALVRPGERRQPPPDLFRAENLPPSPKRPAPIPPREPLPSEMEYAGGEMPRETSKFTEFTTPEVSTTGRGAAQAAPASSPSEINTTTAIDPSMVVTVEFPLAKLKLSKDVPNFKGGASEETGTVAGQELTGKYERRGTAPIVAWERTNGDVEVITGRHRFDLAKRTGEKTIPTQIVREADGFTKEQALTFDAEANIRDGQGEVTDYATYFKGTNIVEGEARARGLLSRAKGKAGWSLAKAATDDVYALWRDGKINDAQAVAIANSAPGDAGAQRIGSKFALQGKSPDFITNVIKASQAEAGTRAQSLDLFGNDDAAMNTMAEQATRASQFQKEISEQIRAVQGAAKRPEVARKLGVDVKDPEAITAKIGELKAELTRWENWPLQPDLVAKVRGEPPPVAAVPKLRAGEKGTGDLLQGADAPFNLAGERGSDFERIAKAKADAEANAQAAKEFEAKNQPDIFGMGGAVPEEFAQSQTTATSIKNAVTDAERIKRGLPPAMEAGRKEFGQTWDEAMARIDADPTLQDRLIAELSAQPRALSDVENALLLHRQVDLQNLYGKFTRDLAQAFDDSQAFPNRLEEVEAGKARVQAVSDQLQTLYDVTRAVGTEQGRGLAARKMLAYEDFSLAKMEMEKRAAKGGAPLTDAERGELVRMQERLEQTQAAFDAYREQQETARANRMTDEAIADMQAELKRRPSYDSRIVKIAEEIVVKLEKSAESASARLKEKFRRTNTGLDPTIVYDLGVVGAAKIARMGLDVTRFGIEMVKEFGEGIEPYLKAAWDRANLHLENEGAKYGDKAPQVKQLLRKQDAMGQRENVIGGLKKAVAEEIPIEMQGDYVRKLAESFVKAGIKEREALIDAVHKVLTDEVGMEITRRETMDAISGYGKFKPLNPDAVKATLRDLRGQMQQVAKLEDIQNRTPLKKTGVQRREPSNEERRLLQQVNEAKRRFGVVVSDPARQLKSALDAIKTRLKNSIADIEYQINTKERIVKSKSPSPFDAETQLLEARRDNLRAQLDELLPKPGLTPEQQAAAVARTLERTIADYERRITAGDMAARKSRPVMSTPQLEALRARRDAVRAEWEELRANSEAYQWQQHTAGLERQKTALEQAIAAKTQQLTEGVPAPAGREVNRPADPMLEQLMQQRDALNAQLAAARRKPEGQKYAEAMARKLAAMQQQIAERQAKLAAGDYSTTGTPRQFNRPLPPDLEIARQQLEAVNAQLAAARKGPQLSPEARALKNLKARLAQATANYKERLAKADFAPRKRNDPPRLDAEALKLKAEHEIARREFHTGLIHDRMANRTTGQKVYAGVKEALNLPRNMLSSWDVSAVLRQGGFIATGNPLRAGRALAPMFRALASERAAMLVEQEILSRPNAPLYKAGKLYLAPHEALHLSAMEEQIMSRFAGKIPGLRASNRAYITFLNRLRADSFDALVASVSRGKDGSLTPKELQAVANYINVATGRGELGKANAAAETLATVFFSPRLLASRFQLIAGQPFYRGTARTRYAIAKEYGKFLAGIGVVYALGTMAGATVETDTRSSDFGKLKFGNTRVDVLGGLSQVTTLLGRLMTGETITARGAVRPIRGDVPYGSRTAADVIAAFLRSKLSPVLGNVVDVATGKNVVGEPVTPGTVAQNMTVPLSLRDLYEVMRDEGMAMGTALGILSLFGYGLQHYEAKQATITQ